MIANRWLFVVLLGFAVAFCTDASGQAIKPLPETEGLETIEQRGEQIPLGLAFRNSAGQIVPLSSLFDGTKPVLLSLNYSRCPMLCGVQINGIVDALKDLSLRPGVDFRYVSVSIDPLESYQTAAIQRQNFVQAIGKTVEGNGVEFLTGSPNAIQELSEAVGFRYRYLKDKKQYVHPPVLISLTPEGVISRYFYSVTFEPQTLRLSLGEASDGEISSVFDRILFTCFQYNSHEGRYTLAAWGAMRLGAILTMSVLGVVLVPVWIRAAKNAEPRPAIETDIDAATASDTMPVD